MGSKIKNIGHAIGGARMSMCRTFASEIDHIQELQFQRKLKQSNTMQAFVSLHDQVPNLCSILFIPNLHKFLMESVLLRHTALDIHTTECAVFYDKNDAEVYFSFKIVYEHSARSNAQHIL
jgi:hypothetical protein